MSIGIKGIGVSLGARMETNEEISIRKPEWDMARVEERTGVLTRAVADEPVTSLDLGEQACRKLFEAHPDLFEHVDGLIFCTSTRDHLIPANACILHGRLGLPERVFGFDMDLSCSGFVYGLALARGLAATGMTSNLLLINADTYHRLASPDDRSTYTLFGDGAAATWLGDVEDGRGVLDIECATMGKFHKSFIIPAGGFRQPLSEETAQPEPGQHGNSMTAEHLHMEGFKIQAFVNTRVPAQVKAILERNGLGVKDVDLFVFHQASRLVLGNLAKLLEVEPERMYSNLASVGNTVSASIPVALRQALDEGAAKPGDRVLVSGFGAGLSCATALIRL